MFQMQVSPSVALRGPRLWSRPGDLRSPCLSQSAMRMGHLPRSHDHRVNFFIFFYLLSFSEFKPSPSCLWFNNTYLMCLCRSSAILWQVTAGVSPLMASLWVAPLCTTGLRCVQVLGDKQPGNLRMTWPILKRIFQCLSSTWFKTTKYFSTGCIWSILEKKMWTKFCVH